MLNTFLSQNESSEAIVSYGKVVTNKDGIIEIVGLEEVVSIGNDSVGLVMNIETASVKALVLGDDTKIIQDDLVTPTGTLFYVPVGESLLGRVVDCLGNFMVGGRQTGKTTVDAIINHRNLAKDDRQKLHCVYVAISERLSCVVNFVDQLKAQNAFDYVTVVSVNATEPRTLAQRANILFKQLITLGWEKIYLYTIAYLLYAGPRI